MIPKLLPSLTFRPKRVNPQGVNNWLGHLPFAADLVTEVNPRVIVELGTHHGESYFGLCQAAEEAGVPALCYAVDTWAGDEHAGFYQGVFEDVSAYNAAHFSKRSCLLKSTFDEALSKFEDESICLLHIDGLHTYQGVSHDFASWYPKVRPGGVILLHDIAARHANFGVWRLWEELEAQYPSIGFLHSWGLGVLAKPAPAGWLADILNSDSNRKAQIRNYYAYCGEQLVADTLKNHGIACAIYGRNARVQMEWLAGPALLEIGHWSTVQFRWCRPEEFGRLAFVPGDCPGLIDIKEVVIEESDEDGSRQPVDLRTCTISGPAKLLPSDTHLSVLTLGPGARIEFDNPTRSSHPCSLTLTVRCCNGFGVGIEALSDWADAFRARPRYELALARSDEQRRVAMQRVAELEAHLTVQLRAQAALQSELLRLQRSYDDVSRSREALLNSLSWRATTPLRAIARPFLKERDA